MIRLFTFTFALLLPVGHAWGAVGDIWDAKGDWSDLYNPNGVWSYRSANGVLMVADNGIAGTCGGSPSDWEGTVSNCPNLFDDEGWGGGHDPDEFCGHGAWMVRWTSPTCFFSLRRFW